MTAQISFFIGFAVIVSIVSTAASASDDYCGIKMVDNELKAVGFIADNKFSTSGSVCPDKCNSDLVKEINSACGSKFQGSCIDHCKSRYNKRVTYKNCCLISGKNHAGECNSYYFANVNGSNTITFVSYTGSFV
uniref:Uncharacterized protein n=1 Tax=Cacopsylla melanoneura TaxID=428564 RepID=A0A8D8RRL6_9HEMI